MGRGRPDKTGGSRRAGPVSHDVLLAVVALATVLLGLERWRDGLPDLTPVSVTALLCALLLARLAVVADARRGGLALALSPAALFSDQPGALDLFPLWSALVLGGHLLWHDAPLRTSARTSGAVLAGAVLAVLAAYIDLGSTPYRSLLVPAAGCLATLLALRLLERSFSSGDQPGADDPPGRAVAAFCLLFAFTSVLFTGLSSWYDDPGTTRTATLLVLTLPVAVLLLVLRGEQLVRRVTALAGAGSHRHSAEPDADDELLARVVDAVPGATGRIQSGPGRPSDLSVPLDAQRHVVLRRRRTDVPFTEGDRRVVTALVAMACTSRDRAILESRLRREVVTDDLTGLWTSSFFHEMLTAASTSRADDETLGVLFLDLDGFAEINQQLGQLDADRVLKEIGTRLLDHVPADGLPARLGGDQFGIVLREVEAAAHVAAECDRIKALVTEPIGVGDQLLQIGVTIGSALSTSARDDMDRVTTAAAEMMARRKQDHPGHRAPPQWANERAFLRDLMSRRRIEVAYQPLVDVRAGRLHGYEALLRAADQDFGVLSPLMLVRAAERLSLLNELSEAVAEQAIPTLSKVADLISLPVSLALSIEFEQLTAGNPFIASLPGRLEGSGVALTLELSERQFGRWAAAQDLVARDLRTGGISLAVDDFGAGYSTFSLLNSWDWDWVKIDRSLVATGEDPQGPLLLRHVTQMLDDLRMTGVAEGIESAEQLDRVRGLGVTFAQGDFLGPPVPAEAMLADLEEHGVERRAWRG